MQLKTFLVLVCGLCLLVACSSGQKDKKQAASSSASAQKTPAQAEGTSASDDDEPSAEEPMDDDEARDELVGIWRVRLAALAEDPEIKKLDEANREKALETAQQMVGNLAFEFTPDGKMNLYMGDKVRNGTYEVLKTAGDVITLKTSHGSANELEVEEVEIVIGEDTLKVTGQDRKQSLVLERGPPGQKQGGAPAPGNGEGSDVAPAE